MFSSCNYDLPFAYITLVKPFLMVKCKCEMFKLVRFLCFEGSMVTP